jgi:FixJ family two-component response regulator
MGLRALPFSSGEDFLDGFDPECAGCVITDLRMHGMSGVELQEELQKQGVTIPVIVLTAYASTSVTVQVMKNGAVTMLDKPYRDNDLWDAIRSALTLDASLRRQSEYMLSLRDRLDRLNAKESAVLNLLMKGQANKHIARALSVSERTVENRRRAIFQKTETESVAELVRLVIEAGQPDTAAQETSDQDLHESNPQQHLS